MLIRVKRLNFDTGYNYAPPQQDAVVNTDHVVSAKETEARGSGPFVELRLTTGETWTVVGRPGDFVIPEHGEMLTITPPEDLALSEEDMHRMREDFQRVFPGDRLVVMPPNTSTVRMTLPDGMLYHKDTFTLGDAEKSIEIIARTEEDVRYRMEWAKGQLSEK